MNSDESSVAPDAPQASVGQILTYCSSLAEEFGARRNRVSAFVKHNLTSGTANEAILRDFLGSISAETFKVTQGFICDPLAEVASRQCDILVFDTQYPLVYSESGTTIVWPESAVMVIEVKTKMKGKAALQSAIENIAAAKRTGAQHLTGVIFSFSSLSAAAAYNLLRDNEVEWRLRPHSVILFDQGVIIRQAGPWHDHGYELRRCIGSDLPALALTYLMLLFLQTQFNRARGFRSRDALYDASRGFIEQYTRLDATGDA